MQVHRYSPGSAPVQLRYSSGTAMGQVTGTRPVLPRNSTGSVQARCRFLCKPNALRRYRPGMAPVRLRYGPGTAPVQHRCKPETAQMQPSTAPVQARYKLGIAPKRPRYISSDTAPVLQVYIAGTASSPAGYGPGDMGQQLLARSFCPALPWHICCGCLWPVVLLAAVGVRAHGQPRTTTETTTGQRK